MFSFFRRKKDVDQLKNETQKSFDAVKSDFQKVGKWIEHLDNQEKNQQNEISELKSQLSAIQNDLEEIKDFVSFFGPQMSKQLFKQRQTGGDKQTAVGVVQTPVQTAVQTGFLSNLTVMERAIVWSLINAEMKLSHEDLSALLGKDKSTIRGQINGIKQKSEGLIEEVIESNGKKRFYIPDKMKEFLLKSVKVRVNSKKKGKKTEKSEEK